MNASMKALDEFTAKRSDVLRFARGLIADRDDWLIGRSYALDLNNRVVRRCAGLAVHEAARALSVKPTAAMRLLGDVAPIQFSRASDFYQAYTLFGSGTRLRIVSDHFYNSGGIDSNVAATNDTLGHDAVLKMFDDAIAAALADEAVANSRATLRRHLGSDAPVDVGVVSNVGAVNDEAAAGAGVNVDGVGVQVTSAGALSEAPELRKPRRRVDKIRSDSGAHTSDERCDALLCV